MYTTEQKITVEWKSENKNSNKENKYCLVSNPLTNSNSEFDKLSSMIITILNKEFPKLKNNSLLQNIVLYSLLDKMKTVQSIENVLSYIKSNNLSQVKDISFKNGEVYIKC